MDYNLFQWVILGGIPAVLGIFGIFSPYLLGERWERITVTELRTSHAKNGSPRCTVVYRCDKSKFTHRKTAEERIFRALTVGKRYKALIRRGKILMLKHPSEYTI